MARATWDAEKADETAATFASVVKQEIELGNLDGKTVSRLAELWKLNYMVAGHKRLGRVLLTFAPKPK